MILSQSRTDDRAVRKDIDLARIKSQANSRFLLLPIRFCSIPEIPHHTPAAAARVMVHPFTPSGTILVDALNKG